MQLIARFKNHPYITACISGLMLAGSFPPSPLGFLSSLAWIPLLIISENNTPKKNFKQWFCFGFIATAGMLYWIGNVLAPGLWHIIVFALILLICYFALYYAVSGLWVSFLFKRFGVTGIIFFPPFWVLLEYIRSQSQLSFPWCTLGYTWGNYLPLIQALSYTGVYAYSFLIIGIGVTLFLLIRLGWIHRISLTLAVLCVILMIALSFYGHRKLVKPTAQNEKAIIALIQPNIDQLQKWDENFLDFTFERLKTLTLGACRDSLPDLIVWPETSMPMYILKRQLYLNKIRELSDSLNIPILFGSLDYEPTDEKYKQFNFYNCAFYYTPGKINSPLLSPLFLKREGFDPPVAEKSSEGKGELKLQQDFVPHSNKENGGNSTQETVIECYRKIRLVPFSEYLPFSNILPILNVVDLGEADFSSGTRQMIFTKEKLNFAPSICYEIIYPSFVRNMVLDKANLLVNITNDGWFGKTSAPFQHLNMARFRCIENRIGLARCANTGISAIIDENGRIRKKTSIMKHTLLKGEVALQNKPTFYSRHGDLIVGLSLILSMVGVGYGLIMRPDSK